MHSLKLMPDFYARKEIFVAVLSGTLTYLLLTPYSKVGNLQVNGSSTQPNKSFQTNKPGTLHLLAPIIISPSPSHLLFFFKSALKKTVYVEMQGKMSYVCHYDCLYV